MFFDARAAKLLKPGQHLVIDGCLGLRLVASLTRKTWTYRYKATDAAGRMKQMALGHWPAMTVQSAATAWEAARVQRGAGTDPGQHLRQARQVLQRKHEDPATYKVRAVVLDYVTGHLEQHRKAAGALAARRALERLLDAEPIFAERAAGSITRADAFDLLDHRKDKPTAAAKLRSMLGSAWDYALDAGRLPPDKPNWWRVVMKGRLKSKGKLFGGVHVGMVRRTLSGVEIGRLLAWLPNMHLLASDGCKMYLWTCARGVEIYGMRPEHVGREADGWWWTVPKNLTKNARFDEAVDLRVPLVGEALEIVQRRLEGVGTSGWLFADAQGAQYLQHWVSTYINSMQPYGAKVKRRQGEGLVLPVTNWTPHDLRRTSRTLLASLGCRNEIGEAILGHMPAEMVGTYNAYTYDSERRLWLEKLSARLNELALQSQAPAALPARP